MEHGRPESQRLRVLFVNHVSEIAGAERSLLDLLRRLDRARFDPQLAAPPGGPLLDEARELEVSVHELPLRRLRRHWNPLALVYQTGHVWWRGRRLGPLIDSENVDILHANSFTALAYAWFGTPPECPIVWHARDLRYPRTLARRMIGRATRVIATSQAVADRVTQICPAAEDVTQVIHNGVDLATFQQPHHGVDLRGELGLKPESKLVGMVAQLVPWKGHDLFLDAAAELALARPDVEFLIVGADLFGEHARYRAELTDMIDELGMAGRVHFIGWRQDIANVLGALSVLMHPAEDEPFGRVVLEAMAVGTPVVALDAAGPREIITNGVDGVLLPVPTRPETIAAVVGQLLKDEALAARLVRGGREKAGYFSAERTARLIASCYDEILWEATEEA